MEKKKTDAKSPNNKTMAKTNKTKPCSVEIIKKQWKKHSSKSILHKFDKHKQINGNHYINNQYNGNTYIHHKHRNFMKVPKKKSTLSTKLQTKLLRTRHFKKIHSTLPNPPKDAHPTQASAHRSTARMNPPGLQTIQILTKPQKQQPKEVATMASDRLVRYQQGTFGYIWKNQNKQTIKTGCRWVQGNIDTMNLFRAEAQGMADCINNVTDQSLAVATLWSNNKGLIHQVNQEYKLHPLQPEWDIIKPLPKNTNLKPDSTPCKRTQKVKPSSPQEIKMNYEANKLAEHAHQNPTKKGITMPGYHINLYIGPQKITTNYGKAIRHATT